jgi:hypothetical protein
VTSQGHPYAVFRRPIERRNLVAAWAAASELQTLSLPDALALCLLVLDREPARFPRFALRWQARLCAETATVQSLSHQMSSTVFQTTIIPIMRTEIAIAATATLEWPSLRRA